MHHFPPSLRSNDVLVFIDYESVRFSCLELLRELPTNAFSFIVQVDLGKRLSRDTKQPGFCDELSVQDV